MFSLTTKRLILRDLIEDDWPVLHTLRSDPIVTKYMEYIKSDTEAESRQWVIDTMVHNAKEQRLSYNLTIIRRADQQILGWIGIGKAEDPDKGDMDFGYALLPAYWGQGYMTEALHGLLDFAFTSLNLTRIYGECDGRNPGSARVMEKAGMSLDARLEEIDEETGEAIAEFRYAVTASEWR